MATYGGEVDYRRTPAEDYARAQINYQTADGRQVVAEATTSWSYVGPGLRISCEVLGPEYSLEWNTQSAEANLFIGRNLDEAQLKTEQARLDEAYDTLLDPVRRRAYDLSTFAEPDQPEAAATRASRFRSNG